MDDTCSTCGKPLDGQEATQTDVGPNGIVVAVVRFCTTCRGRERGECARHYSFRVSTNILAPWYTVRCCHIGTRFVVENRHGFMPWAVVDYVEDLPDGDVIVENGRPDDWDRFVARMERDDPPVNDMT